MPFLFHAEKKSIFQQEPSRELTPNTLRRQEDIFLKQSRSAADYKVSIILSKDHPFRTIKTIKSVPSFQNDTIKDKTHNSKQQILKKFYEMKWVNEARRAQKKNAKQEKQIQQTTRIESIFQDQISGVGSVLKDQLCTKTLPIHIGGNRTSSNKHLKRPFVKKHSHPHNVENQTVPGPGSYNPKLKDSYKNSLFFRRSQQKSTINSATLQNSSESSFLTQSENSNKNSVQYFQFDYKSQLSANFKLPCRSINRNDSLQDILLGSKVTANTICTQQQDEQIELIDKHPGPGQYHLAKNIAQQRKQNKKVVFISGVQKSTHLKKTDSPGPGTYSWNKQPKETEMEAPFQSRCPRQLHFNTENLCKQEFLYTPKTSLIDCLPHIPRHPSNFGSSLRRFPLPSVQELDPHRYASLEWIHPKNNPAVSMQFGFKRHLWREGDFPIGPGQYSHQTMTIEKGQMEINQKMIKKLKFIQNKENLSPMPTVSNIAPAQAPHFALISQQSPLPLISESNQLVFPILHSDQKDKPLVPPPLIAFGQLPSSQNNRGIPHNNQFDGYYDLSPSWQQQSFNIHYRSNS